MSASGHGRQREWLPNIPTLRYEGFEKKDLNLIKFSQILVRARDKKGKSMEFNIIYPESHRLQLIESGSDPRQSDSIVPSSGLSQKGNLKKMNKLYLALLLMLHQLSTPL